MSTLPTKSTGSGGGWGATAAGFSHGSTAAKNNPAACETVAAANDAPSRRPASGHSGRLRQPRRVATTWIPCVAPTLRA